MNEKQAQIEGKEGWNKFYATGCGLFNKTVLLLLKYNYMPEAIVSPSTSKLNINRRNST